MPVPLTPDWALLEPQTLVYTNTQWQVLSGPQTNDTGIPINWTVSVSFMSVTDVTGSPPNSELPPGAPWPFYVDDIKHVVVGHSFSGTKSMPSMTKWDVRAGYVYGSGDASVRHNPTNVTYSRNYGASLYQGGADVSKIAQFFQLPYDGF